jgi:imidazole glycerol-phosphate synthase subunit HisF
MKKRRMIPVLLLKNGWLVQSKEFKRYQNLGNPITAVKRLSEWGSDELIYLDISKDNHYDIRRADQNYPNRDNFLEIIEDVSKVTFMPITVGGKINTLNDVEARLKVGADKVSINSGAFESPAFVEEAAREFGAQCIVVSVDAKLEETQYKVYQHKRGKSSDINVLDYVQKIEDSGAGEILLNSVDRDGTSIGYDIQLLSMVSNAVNIPVIACGGVGEWFDFKEALEQTKVDAIAAANIFHYRDQSVYIAKKYLFDKNMNVRPPGLLSLRKI